MTEAPDDWQPETTLWARLAAYRAQDVGEKESQFTPDGADLYEKLSIKIVDCLWKAALANSDRDLRTRVDTNDLNEAFRDLVQPPSGRFRWRDWFLNTCVIVASVVTSVAVNYATASPAPPAILWVSAMVGGIMVYGLASVLQSNR